MAKTFFISHAFKDGQQDAEELVDALEYLGASCFLGPRDQPPPQGRDFAEDMFDEAKTCTALVVLATEQAMDSKTIRQEIAAARSANRPIVPILKTAPRPPLWDLISTVQCLPWTGARSTAEKLIVHYVRKLPTIAIVDDKPDSTPGLAEKLRYWGFVVTEYTDGKLALARLTQNPVDLAILDHDLGEDQPTGQEMFYHFRSSHPEMALIILTGSCSGFSTELSYLEAGVDDYIRKPIPAAVVAARARRVLLRAMQSQKAPAP